MSREKIIILDEFAAKIPNSNLPTKGDVIKAIFYENVERKITHNEAIEVVTSDICELWQASEIPALRKRTIKGKIKNYWQKYYDLRKIPAGRSTQIAKWSLFKVCFHVCLHVFQQRFVDLHLVFKYRMNRANFLISLLANVSNFDHVIVITRIKFHVIDMPF